MSDYDYDDADDMEEGKSGLDMAAVQKEWAEKIEKRQKDMANYYQEVDRSIKWLRLNKNGRKVRSTGDKLNVAWSNYEIMQQAIYARPPKPVAQPRFGGGQNREMLIAVSGVLERAIESNAERAGLHGALLMGRDDMLKAGIGQLWVRYDPTFETKSLPVMDEATGQPVLDQAGNPLMMPPQEVTTDEKAIAEYVRWDDYLEGAADIWAKVPWVARRVRMSKDAFKKRFGEERMQAANVDFTEPVTMGTNASPKTDGKVADVWEIWCKESRKVYFIVPNALEAIEVSGPFLNFDGFYPCPEPAMAACEDGSRIPIPITLMIEDQLVEIDALTKRINALREGLRVRGFYPKGATATTAADEIEAAVKSTDDRAVLVPVAAWAVSGKAEIGVVWLPIDMVATVIQQCTQMRREAIELVYQVTGISDVMRGASEASETLGAQQIKAQWGSIRVQSKQGAMARLARDACRLMAEIICEKFMPKTIAQLSVHGFDPQMMEFLRQDRTRSLLLDVETDSTTAPDEEADKARRMEFATAIGGLIQQAMPVAQAAPEVLPAIGALIKFVAAGFRAGRELEGEIDKAMQALQQRVSQPPQPTEPDPTAVVKSEAEKAKAQATIASAQADVIKANAQASAMLPVPAPQEIIQ